MKPLELEYRQLCAALKVVGTEPRSPAAIVQQSYLLSHLSSTLPNRQLLEELNNFNCAEVNNESALSVSWYEQQLKGYTGSFPFEKASDKRRESR